MLNFKESFPQLVGLFKTPNLQSIDYKTDTNGSAAVLKLSMCVSTLTDWVLIKKTVKSTICSVTFHKTVKKFWSLIFCADEEEICPEQQAIIKLIYQQKQATPPQSRSLQLPHINFVDYKKSKL